MSEEKLLVAEAFTKAISAGRRYYSRLDDVRQSLVMLKSQSEEVKLSIRRLPEMQRELDILLTELGRMLP